VLSIVVVNYKTSHDVDICLDSIEKYEPNFNEYEFIVVDNCSKDSGFEKLKVKHPYVKLIYAQKNGGFAYGNNRGFEAALGDVILMLNPDTYLKDNAIEKAYKRLIEDPEISLLGPKLIDPDGTNQSYFHAKTYPTLWRVFCERMYLHRIFKKSKLFNSYFQTYMDYGKERYVEQICGGALMFKRFVVEKIGYIDEEYFMYFEETDWCRKAVKCGLKLLYYPESVIVHDEGLTKEENTKRNAVYFVNSLKYYFKKNGFFSTYYATISIYLLGTLIRVVVLYIKGDAMYLKNLEIIKNLLKRRRLNENCGC